MRTADYFIIQSDAIKLVQGLSNAERSFDRLCLVYVSFLSLILFIMIQSDVNGDFQV